MATNLQGTAGAWAASSARTASGETQLIANNGATFYLTGIQLEAATLQLHSSIGHTEMNWRSVRGIIGFFQVVMMMALLVKKHLLGQFYRLTQQGLFQ